MLHAFPSAVSGFDEFYPGLVTNGLSDSYNNQFLRDDAGLIELYTYYSSATATETVAGGAAGRAWQTKVKQGEKDGGSNILGGGTTVARKQYYARTFGPTGATATTFPLATDTRYRNADGTGLETTSCAYTWYPGGARPERIVTTLPTATTAQNGPNSGDTTTSVYDIYGRETWTQDGDGFLHFREYDVLTGAVTKSIVDVDTTQTGTFSGLPAGWATPTGGGLHLTTTVQVDGLGRVTRQADAGGSVTFTVYNDPAHEVRVYRGWNATTGTTTGPVEVAREYRPATPGGAATTTVYRESLTTSAAPSTMLTSAGLVPTGTESITAANLQSLVRAVTNNAGQVVETDRYFSFSGSAYSPTTLYLGTAGTASAVGNYHPTMTDYDSRGVVKRAVEPSGTITRRVYDGFERIVAVWVGTDDTPTAGFWSPSNTVGTDLVKVAAYEYDNGLSGGDGLLTTVTQIPGLGAPDRVTRMAYDWRGRLVVTKAGVEAVEDPSVNRLLTYTDYDNADRPLRSSQYDGDGVGVADANADGVPDQPAAALLRGQVTSEYDNRGRVFRETRYGVDPASGVVGAGLTTAFWRDRRDNVIKVQAPGAATQKFQYDGAGRAIVSFLSDGGGDATWSDAKTVTGDAVLEQTDVTFDGASNMILVHTRQRFHDATGTGALQALTSSTRPSRSSYQASYYDAANRLTASVNVGTNGGVAYARPSSVPARSDTALVTTYAYDAAGRVQDVTDPRGIVLRTLSDALGRTTATIANYTGGVASSQTDVTTLFTVDFAGRLASRTAVQPAGTPSQVTGYVYGVSPATGSAIASNDILAETLYPDPATGLPSATDRDVSTTNALGERTSFTDRAGTTHAYAYDVLGRETTDAITALGAGVDGAVRRIESAYDALGRVTSVTSFAAPSSGTAVNQVTRTFNGFGQITSEWQAHTGLVDPATTPQIQYAYSEGSGGNHSRPARITYPDGYQLTSAYTGLDAAVSRPTSLSGQSAGSAAAVTLEAFKYLGLGTVIERTRPEVNAALSMVSVTGATGDAGDKYTGLDRFRRVVDQRWTQGTTATSPVLDRYGYTYDRNSNRLTRSNALAAAFSETYAYDALNQLQSFSRTGGTTTSQQWQFDALGNWTTFTTNGVAQTHTANAQNEVTQVGGSALAYSQTGTLTTDAEGRTLAYDAWNRLVSVKNASGVEVARYAYDGLNRRVVEQVGTPAAPAAASAPIRDVYYSQEWQALEERVRTSIGAIPAIADTRFIWSPEYVDAMVARDRNADGDAATGTGGLEERIYALQDANWNTTAILAASGVPGVTAGAVINRFVYTPYGESQTLTASWATLPVGSTPATPWAHLFQSLEFTAVTGLAYVRHRDYSATLGRFIELDPIGFEAGDSNWYRFVTNGPAGKTDPSGLQGPQGMKCCLTNGKQWPQLVRPIGECFTSGLNIPDLFKKAEKLEAQHGREQGTGGFRHCYMACMMNKCFGLAGHAARLLWDCVKESPSNPDSIGDMRAEDVGESISRKTEIA